MKRKYQLSRKPANKEIRLSKLIAGLLRKHCKNEEWYMYKHYRTRIVSNSYLMNYAPENTTMTRF